MHYYNKHSPVDGQIISAFKLSLCMPSILLLMANENYNYLRNRINGIFPLSKSTPEPKSGIICLGEFNESLKFTALNTTHDFYHVYARENIAVNFIKQILSVCKLSFKVLIYIYIYFFLHKSYAPQSIT